VSGSQRVLIVDDDPAVREILSAILQREAVSCDVASDGEQAVELLAREPYGAVLLDLLMPRLDGEGVIRFMKEQGIDTPVIVMSAAATDGSHDLDAAIVRVQMQKPIELGDLRAVVRAILKSARA
jgi:two-component system response regulator MprA